MQTVNRLFAAAVVASTLWGCAGGSGQGDEKAVEKVNGTVITKAQLDRAVNVIMTKNRGGTPAPEQAQKVAESALRELTDSELMYQEGAKLPIPDLDRLVDRKFASNRATFPSEAEFKKALESFHMTEEDVRKAMRREIVVTNYVEKQFVSKTVVSEEDARKFYEQNLDRLFRKGERLKASHILISVDAKAPTAERKKAREKAEAILKRVRSGEDFATLARTESNCPSSSHGGELGAFGRGVMTPPFEKAAFALKPGEVSPVVETEFGYHVIKLAQRLPPTTEPFEQVKGKIKEYLKKERVRAALESYLAGLRFRAKIEKL